MTSGPPRGPRRRDDDFDDVIRRTRRRRARTKGTRKRRVKIVLLAVLIIMLAMFGSGVGAVVKFRRGQREAAGLSPRPSAYIPGRARGSL